MKSIYRPKGNWLLGNILDAGKDPIRYPANLALQHGPIVQYRILNKIVNASADADVARLILVQEADCFVRGIIHKRLSLVTGKGMITSEGDYWLKHRRISQPAFHREHIKKFTESFIDLAYGMDKRWEGMVGKEVAMSFEMGRFTLQAAGGQLFSVDLAEKHPELPAYLKKVLRFVNVRNFEVFRFPIQAPIPKYREFRSSMRYLDEIIYSHIKERRASNEKSEDLLTMFLNVEDADTGEKMSDTQIRDEFFTVLMAGFETSSIALTWCWYLMDKFPEQTKKMIEEHEQIIGSAPVNPGHLHQLVFTKQFLQEAMRLYPPVFALPRDIARDIEVEGYHLPKGQSFLFSTYGLHHNPKYWNNPEHFNPDHFSAEQVAQRHKFAYIPFGNGRRICIGAEFAMVEMIALLAVLARKYAPKKRADYSPEMIPAITTNVSEGMPMRIEYR